MTHRVLVARLLSAYEYDWGPVFSRMTPRSIRRYAPVAKHMDEIKRSDPALFNTPEVVAYDRGRVRYFVDQLNLGVELDPIEIDNDCGHRCIYPVPLVLDGHHRLWAYHLVGREHIPVTYGGRQDVLDYLTGRRTRPPTETVHL